MPNQSPEKLLQDARKIASQHGLFAIDKGGDHLLFRKTEMRPVFLGKRSDAAAFHRFVARCAKSK